MIEIPMQEAMKNNMFVPFYTMSSNPFESKGFLRKIKTYICVSPRDKYPATAINKAKRIT